MLKPKLEVLPEAQGLLWKKLDQTPKHFVLYGGTAIALRLGHRQSVDFDFFSNQGFEPSQLFSSLDYLRDARVDQRGDNTLSVIVDQDGPVKLSFFGDVRMNRVQEPDVAPGNGLQVASLLDLSARKLKTIQQRAEAKDYRDIAALLGTGLTLANALAAAIAVYGRTFNAMAALKALTYFGDGNLPSLSQDMQDNLRSFAEQVKLQELPRLTAKPGITLSEL